ncbi:hypothetical protein U1Q18_023332 [Sarracenia purpurea var. burkii]
MELSVAICFGWNLTMEMLLKGSALEWCCCAVGTCALCSSCFITCGVVVKCCFLVEFNYGDVAQGVCFGVVLLCSGYRCFVQQQLVFLGSALVCALESASEYFVISMWSPFEWHCCGEFYSVEFNYGI